MDRPSLLVLIRHGESERNKAKKGATYFADEYARKDVEGIPDHKIALTPEGWDQARKTGVKLAERFGAPDYLYHSGYRRTKETAEGILEAYGDDEMARIKVRSNHFIRERDSGFAYDMTTEEAEANFPYLKKYWETFGGFLARPPGGQSLADKTEEVYLFLNMLFRDRAGQKVFVVTHGGTLRCFRFLLEHWDYERATKWPPGQSPENCGVTVYEFDPHAGRLLPRDYNTVYWK
jgi:broad specificity phosphatase PhoE